MNPYNIKNGLYYSSFGLTYDIKDDKMLVFCKLEFQSEKLKYEYYKEGNKFINIDNENDIFELLFTDGNKIYFIQEDALPVELKRLTFVHRILEWFGYEFFKYFILNLKKLKSNNVLILLLVFNISKMNIPTSFYDPISKEIMQDPVITPLGISYERSTIEEWLGTNNTCPMTNTNLTKEMLNPNRALKDTISEMMKMFGDNIPKKLITQENSDLNVSTIFNGENMLISLNPSDEGVREPNHICVVIDTSGSMQQNVSIKNENGELETFTLTILDLVKYATKVIIKVLEPIDRLSIISYNSYANVVLDSCQMTEQGKINASQILESLNASGEEISFIFLISL